MHSTLASIRRATLPACGLAWALALGVAGLWTLAGGAGVPDRAVAPLGLAAFAAGQLVFLAIVADRTWRSGSRPIGLWLQTLLGLATVAGLTVGVGALLAPAGRVIA